MTKPAARPFTWSLSALKDFEKCPRLYEWRRVNKHAEPPSKALERGNILHAVMENAVKTGAALPGALASFNGRVAQIRKEKHIEIEQMWCYSRDLSPVASDDYENTWLRMKLDFSSRLTKTRSHVLDWKSGQIYGDHAEGMNLYALGAFQRSPDTRVVEISLEYLDAKRGFTHEVKRTALPGIIKDFVARVKPMEKAYNKREPMPPDPGKHCGYCPFNASKPGGTCKEGQIWSRTNPRR